jgi:hypothetical protein
MVKIGDGLFFLSGDSNVFSDDSHVGYTDHDNGVLVANICDQATFAIQVEIDIKPGSEPNCFNNDGHGVIPVAILTTDTFDATTVDPSTVSLDGAGARLRGKSGNTGSHEDVDNDGDLDLVVQMEDTNGIYEPGDAVATLMGTTFDGTQIVGSDDVCIVPGG